MYKDIKFFYIPEEDLWELWYLKEDNTWKFIFSGEKQTGLNILQSEFHCCFKYAFKPLYCTLYEQYISMVKIIKFRGRK